jgi:thymidylate synthase
MNKLDTQYKNILQNIIDNGEWEDNRTGIRAKTIPSAMIQHTMSDGFPLLTIKRVPFRVMAVELEGFIKGITSKKWFQDRNCHIWDEWCNPQKVPYGHDEETKRRMLEEDDLGLIYGVSWRDFHDPLAIQGVGIDQLKNIINTLQKNPQDRRMICSAWNPLALEYMALPPCHSLFQVSVINNKLNLAWFQRSCDILLGIPFNIASYGLLLHLFAKFYGFEEGTLTGFLNNVHIYENQRDGLNEIMTRSPDFDLPTVTTDIRYENMLTWEYSDTTLQNYKCLSTVRMPVAV